jgi:hypothetical protein
MPTKKLMIFSPSFCFYCWIGDPRAWIQHHIRDLKYQDPRSGIKIPGSSTLLFVRPAFALVSLRTPPYTQCFGSVFI